MIIWELANEPRGMNNVGAYHKWIDATARLIKSLAPAQLVTTGSEGQTASPVYAGLDVVDGSPERGDRLHLLPHVGRELGLGEQGEPGRGATRRRSSSPRSTSTSTPTAAAKVGKPILLEEFGFPRDGGSFDPASPVTLRDQYFQEVYALVHSLLPTTPMAGIMPWAWAGDSRPPRPGAVLEAGRSVHRRSAPRGAGLVQRLRQGRDAEADHGVVAAHHRRRAAGAARGPPRFRDGSAPRSRRPGPA